MELSRAVAASACVPMVFEPMRLRQYYRDIEVSLVDGGVFDNQGTVALLGSDCHVVLVSDACGQLMLERMPPTGVTAAVLSAKRSMDTLMERVRLANFSHLAARRRSGLLRGLMSLHMKAGLNGPVIRLGDTTETYDLEVTQLSPLGVRRDFQQALAEGRTELDAFTAGESLCLMACGYQMASKALDDELPALGKVWEGEQYDNWPFKELLGDIRATGKGTGRSAIDRSAWWAESENLIHPARRQAREGRTPMPKPLCFVLMPFGQKPGAGGAVIDFDAVYRDLIKPTVDAAGLTPLRADEEQGGGIIHKPMFERLILCLTSSGA